MKLNREYQAYMAKREELLAKHEGKFVLFKGNDLIDIFASYEDALKEGLRKFGNTPFLVKQIQREEEVNFFYSNVVA